jgi:hypothetical protein
VTRSSTLPAKPASGAPPRITGGSTSRARPTLSAPAANSASPVSCTPVRPASCTAAATSAGGRVAADAAHFNAPYPPPGRGRKGRSRRETGCARSRCART